jgi:hypothetical protein
VTAAEDDEVIGIRDDMSVERFAAARQTPIFQEPVHVDGGEQGACNSTLGRAALGSLAAAHAPGSVFIPFFDWRFQPHLDEAQHIAVYDTPGHRFEELGMRNRIEVLG